MNRLNEKVMLKVGRLKLLPYIIPVRRIRAEEGGTYVDRDSIFQNSFNNLSKLDFFILGTISFFFLLPAMLLCKDGWNSPLAIGGHQSCSLDNDRTEHMLFKARAPC